MKQALLQVEFIVVTRPGTDSVSLPAEAFSLENAKKNFFLL